MSVSLPFQTEVFDEWNLSEQHVIDSGNTNIFRNNLDKYLTSLGLYRSLDLLSPSH